MTNAARGDTSPDRVVQVDHAEPAHAERFGALHRVGLHSLWHIYEQLFAAAGLPAEQVRPHAERAAGVLAAWAPDLAAEAAATARGSGLEAWQVHALGARTELLAEGRAQRRGECSTLVHRDGGATRGAQTWDWHEEVREFWRVVVHHRGASSFATMTELGVPGKIGINAAGVGVLFNILLHRDDRAGGVPVHAVARRVLDSARDLDEAEAIVRSAPMSASTALTLLSPQGTRAFEVAAGHVRAVGDEAGWFVRTNHFLDPVAAAGDEEPGPGSTSLERRDALRRRTAGAAGPTRADSFAGLLHVHAHDGAAVCEHPEPGAALGERWTTLVTLALDTGARSLTFSDGGPCTTGPGSWRTVQL